MSSRYDTGRIPLWLTSIQFQLFTRSILKFEFEPIATYRLRRYVHALVPQFPQRFLEIKITRYLVFFSSGTYLSLILASTVFGLAFLDAFQDSNPLNSYLIRCTPKVVGILRKIGAVLLRFYG